MVSISCKAALREDHFGEPGLPPKANDLSSKRHTEECRSIRTATLFSLVLGEVKIESRYEMKRSNLRNDSDVTVDRRAQVAEYGRSMQRGDAREFGSDDPDRGARTRSCGACAGEIVGPKSDGAQGRN